MNAMTLNAEKIRSRQGGDAFLIVTVILLAGIGLAVLFSATYGYAGRIFNNPFYFLGKQSLFIVIGAVVCVICSRVKIDYLKEKVKPLTLTALFIQLLPFLPLIGMEKNGAHRWINLGFTTIQPSEFLKPVLVLYLAYIFAKKAEKSHDLRDGLLPPLLLTVASVGLTLLQNDFSTAILIALIAFSVFWVADVPGKFVFRLLTVAIPLAIFFVITSEYRLQRIITFLFPDYDRHGIAYQVNGSLRAIGSGGFWGKGLGLGTRKVTSVPEIQADFVFAAFAEEAGFAGVLAFIALWVAFAYRAFRAAFKALDSFSYCLGVGLASALILQTLINMGVAVGAIPATGVPMPFFSSGGSSLISTFVSCGLLINLSRNRPDDPAYI
jgi:cell division protein FtsW